MIPTDRRVRSEPAGIGLRQGRAPAVLAGVEQDGGDAGLPYGVAFTKRRPTGPNLRTTILAAGGAPRIKHGEALSRTAESPMQRGSQLHPQPVVICWDV